ncbi:MAG: rRNA large subunit methyltransferase I, partial [Eubacteriales bacterium]
MKKREYPLVTVTKKAQFSLADGHPWVYDTEVVSIDTPELENGSIVDVAGPKENYLGTGIYSEKSKIRVRILSRGANDRYDRAFFERRIAYAWEYRKTVMRDDISACRIIFGEADRFPGLTVDRFGDVLVTQTLSVGMEKLKDMIFPLLYEVLTADGQHIRGIYERNDVPIRALEGLEEYKGWYALEGKVKNPPKNDGLTVTEITENGLRFKVDFENGQKTGYFLDQKYNRAEIA